jgi:2-polyprenyl-3-methyl-5-hydroxy-6-metoxy-1,4-benzoquinol methylase
VATKASSALRPDHRDFDISDEADLAALFAAEEKHFWHRSRNSIIVSRLESLGIDRGARLLDLGCGAGCVAAELSRRGYRVTGIDGHQALIEVARTRAPSATFLCRDLREGVSSLDAAVSSFDVVALFDVIEHLEQPAKALGDALSLVAPGGFLVGTVPALMLLWSGIDERSGHKTRYGRQSLRSLLTVVRGAEVVEVTPFFRGLVPLLWAQRRWVGRSRDAASSVRNLGVPARPINRALYELCVLEERLTPLLEALNLPGASLWFALKKGPGSLTEG